MPDKMPGAEPARFRYRDACELGEAERREHERCLRVAIDAAKARGMFFSAAIFDASGNLVSIGINSGTVTNVHHSEVAAIINAVEATGNPELRGCKLYVTGEPCPLCASAIIWSCIDTVVWGTSVSTLVEKGYEQFSLSYQDIAEAAPAASVTREWIGGLLTDETDPLFDTCPYGTWRRPPAGA